MMRLDIEHSIAWAVALVARRARSVALLRSLSEAESRPASSLARCALPRRLKATALHTALTGIHPLHMHAQFAALIAFFGNFMT